MTPSFMGRMAWMLPGVRPNIQFRLFSYRQDVTGPRLDGDHARLSQNNAAITHVHQRVRGSQIDANIGREII